MSIPTAVARPRRMYWIGLMAAILMAFLWFVAGIWKLTDLGGFQVRLTQFLVPVGLSMPATLALVVSELFAGVLLLVPSWRRAGGYLSAALLLVFMAYVGINYETLKGEDCSCFPLVKRAVGPVFFWSDGAMVALAALAAWFSPPFSGLRKAAYVLGAVVLLTGTMFAVHTLSPPPDVNLPAVIAAEGGQVSLREGRTFIYFFNPMCTHCLDAGIALAQLKWKAQFVAVPTEDYDLAPGFIEDTGLKDAKISPDVQPLREAFPFKDPPYAAAVEDGRVRELFPFFEEPEMGKKLRAIGFVE